MGLRGELFSTRVILQNRTYFFNVKENRMGDLYLNIVESKNRDEGGFDRQSVILFADDLQEFLKGFDESLRILEKETRERRRSARTSKRDDGTSGHADGENSGYADGRTSGHAGGRTDGYTDDRVGGHAGTRSRNGKTEGRSNGRADGRNEGRTGGRGRASNRSGGHAGGRSEGRADGRSSGRGGGHAGDRSERHGKYSAANENRPEKQRDGHPHPKGRRVIVKKK